MNHQGNPVNKILTLIASGKLITDTIAPDGSSQYRVNDELMNGDSEFEEAYKQASMACWVITKWVAEKKHVVILTKYGSEELQRWIPINGKYYELQCPALMDKEGRLILKTADAIDNNDLPVILQNRPN